MGEHKHPTGARQGRPAGSGVQTIDRAAAILLAFSGSRPALGVTQVAATVGLSTSTAFRLVSALEHHGLLRQLDDRRYVLGPMLLQLGHVAAAHAVVREVATPIMQRLRDQVEETVGLHELSGLTDRVTISQAESRLALRRTYTEMGRPIPLPQGAPGKALLAYLSRDQQEAVLAGSLSRITSTTITDPGVLRSQLAETRRTGYSISLGERTVGIRSVAAPLWNHTGRPVACLSVSAPEMRMDLDRCHALGVLVREAAWEVSELLGASLVAVDEATAGARAPGERAGRRARRPQPRATPGG